MMRRDELKSKTPDEPVRSGRNRREPVGLQPTQKETTMKAEIKDGKLIITLDVQAPTPSASGKTLVIASTHGNATTTATVDGKPVIIGVNAYIKR